jgi:hypothetical protein
MQGFDFEAGGYFGHGGPPVEGMYGILHAVVANQPLCT